MTPSLWGEEKEVFSLLLRQSMVLVAFGIAWVRYFGRAQPILASMLLT